MHQLLILAIVLCCTGPAGAGPAQAERVFHRPVDYTLSPVVDPEETAAGPARIVSVAPSITEWCAALGLADRIVGRTQYCTHPPAVQGAEIVGAYSDTNYEKIVQLRPDITLITDSSPKVAERLAQLGIRYASVPDDTLEDVFAAAAKLGAVLDRPRTAAALSRQLRQDLDALSAAGGQHAAARVLFTFTALPPRPEALYAVGPGGYLDSLLVKAGYTNAIRDLVGQSWSRISLEVLVASKPDYILEVRPAAEVLDVESLYDHWSDLEIVPAIGRRRVRSLHDTAAAKPGPRINLTLYEIIRVLSE